MVTGTTVTLVWYILEIPGVHAYFPGIIASIIVFPAVSLLTPPPDERIIKGVLESWHHNSELVWPQILCTGFWGLPVCGFSRLYSLILINSCLALMP